MNQALSEIYRALKFKRIVKNQSDFSNRVGYNRTYISELMNSEESIPEKLKARIQQEFGISRQYLDSNGSEGEMFESLLNEPETNYPATVGDQIRLQKAIEGSKKGELLAVPIRAQAGYSQRYQDPVFLQELVPFTMPGLPYQGDRYRAFEVEGDSMEYYDEKNGFVSGFSEGMWVIGERVEKDYWNQTNQYYVYVVVTDDRIMLKRLYRTPGGKHFVCISDNPLYAQFALKMEEVRELWFVKRKITWDMPPPRKISIEIDIPE